MRLACAGLAAMLACVAGQPRFLQSSVRVEETDGVAVLQVSRTTADGDESFTFSTRDETALANPNPGG